MYNKKAYKIINNMFKKANSAIAKDWTDIATSTARNKIRDGEKSGAVGDNPVVTQYFQKHAPEYQNKEVLDFGAGHGKQTVDLRNAGMNVTAYDLPQNQIKGLHDPDALKRQYDALHVSNVLNVLPDNDSLHHTIGQIRDAMKDDGHAIANFPLRPRKNDNVQKAHELEPMLRQYFNSIEKVGGSKSEPIYRLSQPIKELK